MFTRLPIAGALCLLVAAGAATAQDTAQQELRWWKGNTHTHSLWSDGDMAPELIAQWYVDRGYHFLAFSEHNVLQEGERHTTIREETKLSPARVAPIREQFGDDWLDIDDSGRFPRMRLKTHQELSAHFNKPGEFLLIQAEEITTLGGVPHVNAVNLIERIPGRPGDIEALIHQYLRDLHEQRQRTGQPMIAHVNHLNFSQAIKAEELLRVEHLDFFEIYNGHPGVNQWGHDERGLPTNDRIWDIVLSLRLREDPRFMLYGVGTDDAHNYWDWGPRESNPGRGWIMVRAAELDANTLILAMEDGDFYSTTGVELATMERGADAMHVAVAAEPGVTYTIQFVGTRAGFDDASEPVRGPDGEELPRATRRYSDEIGVLLQETQGPEASYTYAGDELYVRARIRSDKPVENPVDADEMEQAWVQPVAVAQAR